MAEIQPPVQPPAGGKASTTTHNSTAPLQKRGPSIHQIYALPAPIRTFPLPAFYPNNPVSVFHVAYAWLGQVFQPPPTEPAVVHNGFWSETTTSVHITDEKSMRALWEQGFYGKGSLSRSEPNWLKREEVRRGLQEAHVSEILTVQRREERAQAKWERARLEQEAIRQTKLEEAQQAEAQRLAKLAAIATPSPQPPLAPVGPLEILALPNSVANLAIKSRPLDQKDGRSLVTSEQANDHAITSGLSLVDQINGVSQVMDSKPQLDTTGATVSHETPSTDDQVEPQTPTGDGINGAARSFQSPGSSSDCTGTNTLKRRKSVRFSPTVESATFKWSDPPSPNRSPPVKSSQLSLVNGNSKADMQDIPPPCLTATKAVEAPASAPDYIVNKEHLQLMPEETFFLTFGLGVLTVTDPSTGRKLSSKDLFTLFRQYSYFPPRNGPDEPDLVPDDEFLVHYAVYHHFRSLGWVPRSGIKFGVDWLLYARGPVFDHAEFGLIVIPSYSDPWWKAAGKQSPPKPWSWLHSVVRVLSHVTKSLVLVYVDVPPPPKFEEALDIGITEAMKLYKVREVMIKRWSSNRNR